MARLFFVISDQAGDYRLTVDGGSDFESATEYPSIYREASLGGRIFKLAIFMKNRNPERRKPGVSGK